MDTETTPKRPRGRPRKVTAPTATPTPAPRFRRVDDLAQQLEDLATVLRRAPSVFVRERVDGAVAAVSPLVEQLRAQLGPLAECMTALGVVGEDASGR